MILQGFDGIGANRAVSLNTAQPTLQVIDGEVVALRSPIGFPLPSAARARGLRTAAIQADISQHRLHTRM